MEWVQSSWNINGYNTVTAQCGSTLTTDDNKLKDQTSDLRMISNYFMLDKEASDSKMYTNDKKKTIRKQAWTFLDHNSSQNLDFEH